MPNAIDPFSCSANSAPVASPDVFSNVRAKNTWQLDAEDAQNGATASENGVFSLVPSEEELSFARAEGNSTLLASTPLYAAGSALLLLMMVSSPLVFPYPDGWYRAVAAIVFLLLVAGSWWYSKDKVLSQFESDILQFLVVAAATGMCVLTQFWNPSGEITYGFVIAPLVLSIVFRSLSICIVTNFIFALAWAVTWRLSGMAVTSYALQIHLLIVPILSIAICITQQGSLRELTALHRSKQIRTQERIKTLRLMAEEASLRAKSEAELRRHHSLLELILATVPDEIFVKDQHRNLLLANSAYLNCHDLKLEDVVGSPTDQVMPSNLRKLSRSTDQDVLRDGVHVRKELVWDNGDGTMKYYEVEKMPLLESNRIVGIVGIARNVTERKEAEKKLREQETMLLHASRLLSMGELVAGIAHEINQPLYAILNYTRAVKNSFDGPRQPDFEDVRNWIGQILNEAVRGGEITKRLRSFVRRTDTQLEEASLSEVVREAIDLIAPEARSSNIELQSDLAEELPLVRVDCIQIQQVLVNLIKNAIEALQDYSTASPRITVTTRHVSDGVEVAVADNGPGLPADESIDITEPFFTTKNEGIGLGLAISNTIIEAHESKLCYATNDYGGATFRFTLGSF